MYIMNRYFSKRGVSQVIAALLLIAIAVAAAILLYVFSIGLLGSLGTGGGQQTKEQLIMEAYNFPTAASGTGSLTLTVRNVGPASVNIQNADFFINGVSVSQSGACSSATLTPGGSCTTTLTYAGSSLVAGAAYPLKIVSPTGGVFSYSIIYGGAS
jgi:flagellin-like protein